MLLTEKVDVKIINHNRIHYNNLGYNIKCGDIITVPVNHLSKGSHIKINVCCDKCSKKNNIKYQHYIKITKDYKTNYYCQLCVKSEKTKYTNLKKYGSENVSSSNIIKKRKEKTNVKNWGVKNVFQDQEIKNKSKETLLEKYGVEFPNHSETILLKSKKTRINNGNQIPDDLLTDYDIYKKKVLKISKRYYKNVFKEWNGYDYYDGEYIMENLYLNPNNKLYPTIDHKLPIHYGFINNITIEKISNMQNLCVTKKSLNSSKQNRTDEEYIKMLEIQKNVVYL